MNTRKIYIYNGEGAAKFSAADLFEFFTTNKLFESQDVAYFSDEFNINQLKCPTIVVPGARSTTVLSGYLMPIMNTFKSELNYNFNYIGVCAGAFLGADDVQIHLPSYELKNNGDYTDLSYLWKTDSFGLVNDMLAIGTFYPVEGKRYKNVKPFTPVPYRLTIDFSEDCLSPNQLFVHGPGFFDKSPTKQRAKCRYMDKASYRFQDRHFEQLCSMVYEPHTDKEGARFLFGTHLLDAQAVKNSKMLGACNPQGGASPNKLTQADYDAFVAEQPQVQKEAVEYLRPRLK